jgi:hypothetical protein
MKFDGLPLGLKFYLKSISVKFMLITILIISLLIIAFFFAKRIFKKRLQAAYERSLLKGDKKKADQLGKIYYLSLDEESRKAKGIIDIDEKISDDFRAFNNHTSHIL